MKSNNKLYLGRHQITPIIKDKKKVFDKRFNKYSINDKSSIKDDTPDKSIIKLRKKSSVQTYYFELVFNWIKRNKTVISLILVVIIMKLIYILVIQL